METPLDQPTIAAASRFEAIALGVITRGVTALGAVVLSAVVLGACGNGDDGLTTDSTNQAPVPVVLGEPSVAPGESATGQVDVDGTTIDYILSLIHI